MNYHDIYKHIAPTACRLLRFFLKCPLCYLKKVAKMCLLLGFLLTRSDNGNDNIILTAYLRDSSILITDVIRIANNRRYQNSWVRTTIGRIIFKEADIKMIISYTLDWNALSFPTLTNVPQSFMQSIGESDYTQPSTDRNHKLLKILENPSVKTALRVLIYWRMFLCEHFLFDTQTYDSHTITWLR